MAIKKKMPWQDDDSLYALRKEDERQWSLFGELAQEVYKDWLKWNDGKSGEPAKSWQDSGRGCPKCAGALMVFQEQENGDLMLQCRNCHTKHWLSDIAPYSVEEMALINEEYDAVGLPMRHFPDELFRTIPDSLVLEYTQLLRKRREQG